MILNNYLYLKNKERTKRIAPTNAANAITVSQLIISTIVHTI
jgi:hypothetical protein